MCKATIKSALAEDEKWLETLDLNAFAADMKELGKNLKKSEGKEDAEHFSKMLMYSHLYFLIGYVTMGFRLNLITAYFLGHWTHSRWLMIAHHTLHGAHDKFDQKKRWHRLHFALGTKWRRLCDWLDWLFPEAWNSMHNSQHHFQTGELADPDLLEDNIYKLRRSKNPLWCKYIFISIAMTMFKWMIYAPRSYFDLKLSKMRRAGKPMPVGFKPNQEVRLFSFFQDGIKEYCTFWEYFTVSMAPYIVIRFMILPLPFLFIGQYLGYEHMYKNAVMNIILAEMVTNSISFAEAIPSHCGRDIYRFNHRCRPYSGSFYLRQVLATANYRLGIEYKSTFMRDFYDFSFAMINYQIEHHLFPNLSMRSMQRAAPLVKAICEKHGVPYKQDDHIVRFKRTIRVFTGQESMRWMPEEYERKFLEIDDQAEKEKRGILK